MRSKPSFTPKSLGGLGFKRLSQFNISLLGKQGWRLLTCPNALFTRVFKAPYFRESGFLEAVLGSDLSYVWRSILDAQGLIANNIGRRIGNGRDTYLWHDPWLLSSDNPRLATPVPAGYGDAAVASLMIGDRWNEPIVNTLLHPIDSAAVLRTPISLDFEDCWFWRRDTNGLYSVKSGYRALTEGVEAPAGDFTAWTTVGISRAKSQSSCLP
ncbi:hypothetical protein OROGR_021423 [Orobanche gracilis]